MARSVLEVITDPSVIAIRSDRSFHISGAVRKQVEEKHKLISTVEKVLGENELYEIGLEYVRYGMPMEEGEVTVECRDETGRLIWTQSGKTDSGGRYRYQFRLETSGKYSVSARAKIVEVRTPIRFK